MGQEVEGGHSFEGGYSFARLLYIYIYICMYVCMHVWQSQVEIEHYSVAYFARIAAFKVL